VFRMAYTYLHQAAAVAQFDPGSVGCSSAVGASGKLIIKL